MSDERYDCLQTGGSAYCLALCLLTDTSIDRQAKCKRIYTRFLVMPGFGLAEYLILPDFYQTCRIPDFT